MIIKKDIERILPIKDLNKLYVVADFDRTITDGNSKSSWSILSESSLVSKSYITERLELYNKYRPIEINEHMDFDLRMNLIKEWYQKHIGLFIKYNLSEEIFKDAATNLRIMSFRLGAKEFIKFLHDNNIPLIIISAGIGNFIETFLEKNDCYFDNVYVSSNKILFKNGIATGVGENIIHSLNKNEVSLPDDIKEKIKGRENVLLLGDQVSDLNMVDRKCQKQVITIAFSTEDYPINDLIANYDIVCENDDNYNTLSKQLFID